jgi:hypothetical protein
VRTLKDPTLNQIDLARFYADQSEELELFVGFSRPIPRVWWDPRTRTVERLKSKWPTMILYSGAGVYRVLKADDSASTPSSLVFRIPATEALPSGWYDPMLKVDPTILGNLVGKQSVESSAGAKKANVSDDGLKSGYERIDRNFTFSVVSKRDRVRLISRLIEDTNSSNPGTLMQIAGYATLQVQVSAGSPVLHARVRGFYQKITKGSGPIPMMALNFADKGLDGDKAADDGIYTAKIDIHDVNEETEFRAFVVVDTINGEARYIPSEELKADEGLRDGDGNVIKFQRAASIQFRVKP